MECGRPSRRSLLCWIFTMIILYVIIGVVLTNRWLQKEEFFKYNRLMGLREQYYLKARQKEEKVAREVREALINPRDKWHNDKLINYLWAPHWDCQAKTRVGGVMDGGKWVCDLHAISSSCVVYSFGSGNDTFFEEDLHKLRPVCDIHIFDPTPWVKVLTS